MIAWIGSHLIFFSPALLLQMKKMRKFMALFQIFAAIQLLLAIGVAGAKQVHIVYMGETGGIHPDVLVSTHHDMLASAMGSVDIAKETILYSYRHGFNGFAAPLSKRQAEQISSKLPPRLQISTFVTKPMLCLCCADMPGVISVFPSSRRRLHTTRSWEFLGLTGDSADAATGSPATSGENIWQRAKFGRDIIIGLLDTGIWPESQSFDDDLLSEIPSKWKGECEDGDHFNASSCNKKLIGARFYLKGYENFYGKLNLTATEDFRSARDKDGHGTHTASTAGGSFVPGANVFGFANGTAKGGAPLARIAMYKVCWPIPSGSLSGQDSCFDEDMLAALDQGIKDGVDIFSISIGSGNPQPAYLEDSIAIGAFHAIKRNILVSCSAGNSGPTSATVANVSPWILTVAASSLDRDFPSNVVLGDGTTLQGKSIAPKSLSESNWYELIDGGRAGNSSVPVANASQCLPDTLDASKVAGKVVICLRGLGTRVGKSQEAIRAGAAGFILGNSAAQANEVSVDAYMLPGTAINADNANAVLTYINSTNFPLVKIVPARTVLDFKPAPSMAAFSSQGPNSLNPDILKPDISAPGLNILAAWTEANSPTKLPIDNRIVKYNIISGTSMSCPHVAGTAALLRAIYPSWSPAAIKSALMTTASIVNNLQQPILNGSGATANPFNFGGGEMNPEAAADPGLVYDTSPRDYLLFLCSVGYNSSTIQNVTDTANFTCPNTLSSIADMNYPSVAVANLTAAKTIQRTVTNVGSQDTAVYIASFQAPDGIDIVITPNKLTFQSLGEKKSFNITLTPTKRSKGDYVFGTYQWSDGMHVVRSPIAVRTTS
ncbi:subtilisin-like protease SBT5.6 isoform X1 [Selaginella moellendorffii]|uniref:subtilisin-like protease SBT5.6 isoform X1 n=2 Tax=Selaginella moellendorffii TaxID=88036 RepID=UPI000D1CCA0D|nr:subtilisin-like protease SBT5.6 isoform X1 [Selaginella moellendorffii]|eukprot:XP_024531986.1 subtilisin-like protease SBT5.6 isoform X1 [Selaginella moellendorffii]